MGGYRRTVAFSDGRQLRFTVFVGTNGDDTEALIDTGVLPRPPVKAKAVIDTGAATTSMSPAVLRQLLAAQVGEADNETAGGVVRVGLYVVSIGFFADDAETISDSVVLNLEVSEFAHPLENTDVLIGMDVLAHCRLLVDGPAERFTIDF
jgi:hypothetical protein